MPEGSFPDRRIQSGSITLVERPVTACVDLRGNGRDERFVRAVSSVTDLAPPLEPGTTATGLFASLLWLGPDEWWLTSDSQSGGELAARLRQALRGVHAAVTEVGDGRIVYAVAGSRARDVLAKGTPLDLHPRALAPGRCAQTVLAKLSVLIHLRAADPVFDVYVARSHADYAWAWLANAAREYLQE